MGDSSGFGVDVCAVDPDVSGAADHRPNAPDSALTSSMRLSYEHAVVPGWRVSDGNGCGEWDLDEIFGEPGPGGWSYAHT